MPVDSLQDLYQQKLQMILDAEQQGLQAYPQMLGMVQHPELRQSLQTHMQQTQQQVQQLQRIAPQGGGSMQAQRCVSMQALVQEAQQMVGQIQDPDTRDAFLIGAAQAMEHHEIAAYGTARAWAQQLGREQDVQVLEQILDQEKQTDALLTQLAERRVNQEAAQGDREVPMGAQREMGSQGSQGAQAGTPGGGMDGRPSAGA
jgi:ferritin-like metal-binding protein YciE